MLSSQNHGGVIAMAMRLRRRRGPESQPEYRQAVRTILPLMQELAGYLAPDGQGGKDRNAKIYGTLSQALMTLAVVARAARMEQRHQLLEEFHLLLADLRFGAWSQQPELSGLTIDFLEFLEAIDGVGDGENSSADRRVRDKLRSLHMLSALFKKQLAEARRYKGQPEESEVAEAAFVAERLPIPEISATRPGEAGFRRDRPKDLEELQNIEEELAAARDAMAKVLEEFSDTLQELDSVKDSLRRKSREMAAGFEGTSLFGFTSRPSEETTARATTEFEPIELDRCWQLDRLIKSFNDISVDFNVVYATLTTLAGDIGGQLCKQQLTMRLLQDKLTRIRMAPMSSFSQVLLRTVRESARKFNKQVNLVIGGEDVFLDRFVWARVTAPLLHILSNAVAHGIESSEQRAAAGKPKIGTIHVEAEQRGRSVILRITDDGGGIDLERIREKISSDGVVDNPELLGEKELLEYLLSRNFAALPETGTKSGRTIGLDSVRDNIEELGGRCGFSLLRVKEFPLRLRSPAPCR